MICMPFHGLKVYISAVCNSLKCMWGQFVLGLEASQCIVAVSKSLARQASVPLLLFITLWCVGYYIWCNTMLLAVIMVYIIIT